MEKFFWADQIADRIIKEKGKKKEYVCASGITPSGSIHIGNFREVITTDLVVRALRDKGKKVRFIYSWDDFDRFRKVPKNVSKSYDKYIGLPLSDVPSPYGDKGSYAEHFEKEFEDSLEKVSVKPEFIRQSKMNEKTKYASLIKIAIENRQTIIDILNEHRKEPLAKDWMPVVVYCEKCGKDDTKILNVDGFKIKYSCKCGFENTIDIRKKGIVKAPWRVDWPMRWRYEKVDFEPGGIDHSTPGGSYTTSKEIVKDVFSYDVPMYQLYEWVRIKGGTEFSSSSGNVITLNDVLEVYEPEVLRYLFVGTRPKKGFQISFDLDVMKIYEDYDKLERDYFEKANPQDKRIYELSKLKIPKKAPKRLSFRNLIMYVQINKVKDLSKIDQARAEKVSNWLEKFAPEDIKFEVQDKVKAKLGKKEKLALSDLRNVLKKNLSEEKLFNEFYKISEKNDLKNSEFFEAAYRVIIGKKRGPRLAALILGIGKDKVIKLLNQL
jgi:lysyl-tRNA synthetase, class I